MDQIKTLPLSEEHLDKTADLHMREMPEDLTSQLGKRAVRDIFHHGMLDYDGSTAYVCMWGDVVAGLFFAQIDFARFSKQQRKKMYLFYPIVMMGLLRKPWLLRESFDSYKYLKLAPRFVNVGPLVVGREFRNSAFIKKYSSISGILNNLVFGEIKKKAPELPVLTMIRPSNILSISAVIQAARSHGYTMVRKESLFFGKDERIAYKFSLQKVIGE